MGNCNCELFYPNTNEEFNNDQNKGNQDNNNAEKLVSQYNQATVTVNGDKLSKINKFKKNFEKKLPEIGKFIPMNEYKKLINKDINNYMSKNKLDYKKYIPSNASTYTFNPIKFKNDNVYYGNWNENNEMEGYGIYYLNERNVITEGIWNKGNIVFGRIFFPNGDIYEGEMKYSFPNGKGKIVFSNKESYEGDFKMGEMSGKGIFIFSDNTEYNGCIENGIFNGEGTMKWENGTEYTGNFVDSTLSGRGTITNIQNEKYQGNFDKNEFNGEGTYYFNNGDEFEGNFEYGIKKGKGIYRRNDKVIFEGIWNDDLPNGNGVISYLGNNLKGFWRNGVFVENSENEVGNLENFNNIDKNIKPYNITIYPSSLSHLAVADSNASQFIPGKDLNFI